MKDKMIYCILTLSGIIGLFTLQLAWLVLSIAYGQQQQNLALESMYVKITKPITGEQVPTGPLSINGISSDNAATDCLVYVDWNDIKPYQKVVPTGSTGQNDYSNWTFTYTSNYHVINQGVNELTAKLSCAGSSPAGQNVSKWYSINVTGVAAPTGDTQASSIATQGTIAENASASSSSSIPSSTPPSSSTSTFSKLPTDSSTDTSASTKDDSNNVESGGDEDDGERDTTDEDIGDLFE
jgi:hypothetical protein